LGGLIGFLFFFERWGSFQTYTLFALVVGFPVGFFQSMVFRTHVPSWFLWIPVNMLSCLVFVWFWITGPVLLFLTPVSGVISGTLLFYYIIQAMKNEDGVRAI